MALTVTGFAGEIRWGYHLASEVCDWTVTTVNGSSEFRASLVSPDVFRLSQQPLTFVAPHAKGAYRWPITTLQITGASCSAMLGPMERLTHVVSGRQT
jgi:hypothetical protein